MSQRIKLLFRYDDWANRRVIESLRLLGPESDGEGKDLAIRWMGHIFVAQRLWLGRLKSEPPPTAPKLFPRHSLDELESHVNEMKVKWDEWLGALTDAKGLSTLSYQTTEGKTFESQIKDILTHVINHGTHHRGQIASKVRELGGKPASTDFIVFTRS